MAAILVFFCLYSNLSGLPRLWVKNSKEYFNPNEPGKFEYRQKNTKIAAIYESGLFLLPKKDYSFIKYGSDFPKEKRVIPKFADQIRFCKVWYKIMR